MPLVDYPENVTPSRGEVPETSLFDVALFLYRSRRFLVLSVALGGLIGLSVGLLTPRRYASSVTFVPQGATDQAASGGLALAASQFGIRIPNGGSGWGPSVYVELLQSRRLLEPIALDTFVVSEDGGRRVAMMDFLEVPEVSPAERVENTITALREAVSAAEDKKLGAVRLVVRTRRASVSFALAQRLVSAVNEFNLRTRQSQARAEREFVERQARTAEIALRAAEDRMQQFLQANRVCCSPELSFVKDRLQRDITARQQEYSSLLTSHAEARIREVRDTPVISVLEAPAVAAIGEARQSVQKALMGGVVGAILAILIRVVGLGRGSGDPAATEFFRLVDRIGARVTRRPRSE